MMKSIISFTLAAAIICLILAPSVVMAAPVLNMEYHVQNAYTPVLNAFINTSLIFSDARFKYGVWVMMTIGLFMSGAIFYLRGLAGGDTGKLGSPFWMVSAIGGMLVYVCLFQTNSCVTVIDDIQNENQQVCNLPDAVVFVAGNTNAVEKGISDIIWNSSIYGLNNYTGGIGFQALLKGSQISSVDDIYVQQSMEAYIHDCVIFELRRPGSTMNLQAMISSSTDLINDFSYATNDAISTVLYSSTNPQGVSASCTDSYNALNPYYTDNTQWQNYIIGQSGMLGYDQAIAATLYPQVVQNTLGDVLGGGTSITAQNYLRQAALANTLNNVLTAQSPDMGVQQNASTNQALSMIGSSAVMNDWMPVIRGVVTAIIISIIPFICFIVPTSLVGKALKLLFGSFVWLMVWGIMDTFTTNLSVSYALNLFQDVRNNLLGVYSIINMPTATQKAMLLFGTLRTFGLGLASYICMQLFQIGGGVFEQLGGQLSGAMQQAGQRASQEVLTPAGSAAALRSLESAGGTWANANRFNYEERSSVAAMNSMAQTGAGIQEMSHLGGNAFDAATQLGNSSAVRSLEGVGRGSAIGAERAQEMGAISGAESAGQKFQYQKLSQAIYGDRSGASIEATSAMLHHGQIDSKAAQSLGASLGLSAEESKYLVGAQIRNHDLSVSGDGKKLMATKIDFQKGDEAFSISNGKKTVSGTWKGNDANNIYDAVHTVNQLKADNHGKTAHELSTMIGQEAATNAETSLRTKAQHEDSTLAAADLEKADEIHGFIQSSQKSGYFEQGRGIKDDEAIKYQKVESMNGNMAEFSASHGSDATFYNTGSEKSEFDKISKNKIDERSEYSSGSQTTTGNSTTDTTGYRFSPGTALYESLTNDKKGFIGQIMNEKDDKKAYAMMQAFAAAYSSDVGLFTQKTAVHQNSSKYSGGAGGTAGVNTPKGSGIPIPGTGPSNNQQPLPGFDNAPAERKIIPGSAGFNLNGGVQISSQDNVDERVNFTSRETMNTLWNAREEVQKQHMTKDAAAAYGTHAMAVQAWDDTNKYLDDTHSEEDRGAGKVRQDVGQALEKAGDAVAGMRQNILSFFGLGSDDAGAVQANPSPVSHPNTPQPEHNTTPAPEQQATPASTGTPHQPGHNTTPAPEHQATAVPEEKPHQPGTPPEQHNHPAVEYPASTTGQHGSESNTAGKPQPLSGQQGKDATSAWEEAERRKIEEQRAKGDGYVNGPKQVAPPAVPKDEGKS